MASAVALCASAELATAGTTTIADGNDRPGRLDIRSASQGHAGSSRVRHTITTFANWPKALLGPSTPNFFLLQISTDSDRVPERNVVIFSTPGRMIAGVFTRRGRFLGRADASHPNGHTVGVVIRRALLGNPAGYRWQAFSLFRGSGGCGGGCVDRAPNGSGRVLHDLRAPAVSFPQPVATSTTYDLVFTVTDPGGSGPATWELQHRDFGVADWLTILGPDDSPGQTTWPFTAGMPGDIDEFRVVAVDGHGNRTVGPIRQVTAP